MATRVSNEAESTPQGVVTTLALSRILVSEEENLRRVNPKDIPKLAKSIQEMGLLQPVIVRELAESVNGFEYRLDAGYRRLAAVRALDWDEVPAMVITGADSMRVNMVENGQKEEVSLIDQALGIKKRMEAGAKMKDIAEDLGKSVAWISQILPLADPEKVRPHIQKAIQEGKVTLRVARLLPGMSEGEQDKFLAEVEAAGPSGSSEVAEGVQKKKAKKAGKGKRGAKPGARAEKVAGGAGISSKKAILMIEETEGELLAMSRGEEATAELKTAIKGAIRTLRVFGKFLAGQLGAQALGKVLTKEMAQE